MNKFKISFCLLLIGGNLTAQDTVKVFPGADERTPSRSQYFSWINNTNEGATEKQTLVNLSFFEWLYKEYGMKLDIYAFDAGVIDGKNFYGSMYSERFKEKFPKGFDGVYGKAKSIGTRLGIWGGPDGFGNSKEEADARKAEMVKLCKDYEWALFKFDAVCGPLRLDKENEFIGMMKECRRYSPDLILLNHRLGLEKAKPYATTFLWGGQETYIDVHTYNNCTAPHNRAGALERGLVPELRRLTEDHGVCISSCLDYWEDDLVLQAFNRNLILAPEIYGNPWLLSDNEFPKLARIYNIHKKYSDILVDGITLPESYGPYAVSRGDKSTRFITMRNLSWNSKTYSIKLDEEIGLVGNGKINVHKYHPAEKNMGTFEYGEVMDIVVEPFRSVLIKVSSEPNNDDICINGTDFEVVRNVEGKDIIVKLLGMPGTVRRINISDSDNYRNITIDGKSYNKLLKGKSAEIKFDGNKLKQHYHRKLSDFKVIPVSSDAEALYEATAYAADNNALEVRSLERSGITKIKEVKDARDAFFEQKAFVDRGVWDKYLFDGNMDTGFWPSMRYGIDQRIKGGCFRLDLGKCIEVDSVIVRVGNELEQEPILTDEGNFAYVSTDLNTWNEKLFLGGLNMIIPINENMRYLKIPYQPTCIREIEVYSNGKKPESDSFRASNLFADSKNINCKKMWKCSFALDEIADNSYISVALNGKHGIEGAYAAMKIDGHLVGAPSRAVSYPSNTWEFVNKRSDSNYTYYFPLDNSVVGKSVEVFVMGYDNEKLDFKPEVWISSYPIPFKEKTMIIQR